MANLLQTYLFAGIIIGCACGRSIPRVYVYELPKHLTQDVIEGVYQERWLSDNSYEYEADLFLHWTVLNSPARTWNPETATLYYIPALPTRKLHLTLGPTKNWHEAVNASSEYLREALQFVQQQPYWASSGLNGSNHFLAITADSARYNELHFSNRMPCNHTLKECLQVYARQSAPQDPLAEPCCGAALGRPCFA